MRVEGALVIVSACDASTSIADVTSTCKRARCVSTRRRPSRTVVRIQRTLVVVATCYSVTRVPDVAGTSE